MIYCTVLLLLQLASLIHGDYLGKAGLSQYGSEYYGMIDVGENKQVIFTLFDTGSNHAWVVTDKKPIGVEMFPNIPFKTGSSSTFVESRRTYEEKFSSGIISGYIGKDKIVVKAIPNFIDLDVVEFGVVDRITEDLVRSKTFFLHKALFGLNLVSKELIKGEPTSSLDILAQKAPVFGFYLHDNKPSMVYGPPDGYLISDKLTPHDVVQIGDKYNGWNVKITKFQVGNSNEKKDFKPEGVKYGQVITSSATVFAGPTKLFQEIADYVFQLGSVEGEAKQILKSFECDVSTYQKLLGDLPVVSVFIDGDQMDIDPKYYLFRRPRETQTAAPGSVAQPGNVVQKDPIKGDCRFLLVPADIDYVIIGIAFMKKYYTQFDYNKKQISFALANYNEPTAAELFMAYLKNFARSWGFRF